MQKNALTVEVRGSLRVALPAGRLAHVDQRYRGSPLITQLAFDLKALLVKCQRLPVVATFLRQRAEIVQSGACADAVVRLLEIRERSFVEYPRSLKVALVLCHVRQVAVRYGYATHIAKLFKGRKCLLRRFRGDVIVTLFNEQDAGARKSLGSEFQ